MTPFASERAALHKNSCSYSRPIVNGKMLNIEYCTCQSTHLFPKIHVIFVDYTILVYECQPFAFFHSQNERIKIAGSPHKGRLYAFNSPPRSVWAFGICKDQRLKNGCKKQMPCDIRFFRVCIYSVNTAKAEKAGLLLKQRKNLTNSFTIRLEFRTFELVRFGRSDRIRTCGIVLPNAKSLVK